MRILQVTARYFPELQYGGPPQKIHALSRRLVARGHVVEVVTLHSDRHMASAEVHDDIPVQYLPWLGRGSWGLPLGRRHLATMVQQADVIHGYGLYTLLCPATAALAARAGRPFVLEPQGMYLPRTRKLLAKRLFHLFFTEPMARRAACLIATSPAEAEELSSLVPPERVILRRNGVDVEAFRNLPPRQVFRAGHGLDADQRVVLYLGRISPIKNLEQLVRAFSKVDGADTCLVLVGPALEPDYARRLEDLVAALGLTRRVLLVGPLYGQDKLAALAAADLFVLPSLSESYGNAAAEAVAAGLPVLLTETCGIAPQIHGRAGLAVPLSEAGLAEGLHTLLDRGECARLTGRRKEVMQELSWEVPLTETERLYERLVQAAPGGAAGKRRKH